MEEKRRSSIDHAKHNEAVCDHLESQTEFTDWIITTAFYTALHYLEFRLFPFTVKKKGTKEVLEYDSFDHYCSANDKSKGRHRERRILNSTYCVRGI